MKRRILIVAGAVSLVIVVLVVGGLVWHEQPSFCSTVCHETMSSYVDSWHGDGDYLIARHAEADVTCLDCHKPSMDQQIAEAKLQLSGDVLLPMAKLEVDDEFCLEAGCHTRDDVAAATANYEVDGITVNPHLQKINPVNADFPHGDGAEAIPCSSCHTMHRESNGIEFCFDCHHAETFRKCEECHDHK